MSDYQGALEHVLIRNDFYRRYYHRMMLLLVTQIILASTIGYGLWKYAETRMPPAYFATDATGELLPLINYGQPVISDEATLLWAEKALHIIHTKDYNNYRQQIQKLRYYFTREGYNEYIKALHNSNNLNAIRRFKYVVYPNLEESPRIKRRYIVPSGPKKGRLAWEIETPIKVVYEDAQDRHEERIKVTLRCVRVSTLEVEQGIAIEQYIAEPAPNV